jgi:hypothetical protein
MPRKTANRPYGLLAKVAGIAPPFIFITDRGDVPSSVHFGSARSGEQ